MGGDRDGNPNVTPQVTYEVAITQRMQAAKLFLRDIDKLYSQLAVCKSFSPQMMSLAREIRYSPDRRELYRRVIGHIQLRLLATIRWCEQQLSVPGFDSPVAAEVRSIFALTKSHITSSLQHEGKENIESNPPEYIPVLKAADSPMFDSEEFLRPLIIMHESLTAGGYAEVADGLLIDIIRRAAVFGLTLCPLDLRQESNRHTEALDAITRYLGIGSYAQWDEISKINWLQAELSGRRPLFRGADIESMGLKPNVLDTLKTFDMASSLGPQSLGAYVISQARSASDVLAVMLLQKQYGMTSTKGNMMRVVPLFETLNDLTNAPQVMETLFSLPNYLGMTRSKHEVMIGYSDSAKDAGRLSAGWAQYERFAYSNNSLSLILRSLL
jgi:phosphoenolpyruvate carboxylase